MSVVHKRAHFTQTVTHNNSNAVITTSNLNGLTLDELMVYLAPALVQTYAEVKAL